MKLKEMRTSVKRIALLALIVVASLQLKAQFHFGINLMGNMPMSNWAEEGAAKFGTNPFKGNADIMGAGIGFRFQYDFSWRYNGIVTPFVDIEGFWNPKNKMMRDFSTETSFTLGHYINGSVMAGAMYRYFLNYKKPVFGIYFEGALGADILYVTQEGWASDAQKYAPSTAFAVKVGLGICITPRLNIGVNYEFLGNHFIEKSQEGQSFSEYRINGEILPLYIPEKMKEGALVFKLNYTIAGNKLKQLPLRNSYL